MIGPIRVLHLFDASARWEQRLGASQLIQKLPPSRFTSVWATLDIRTRHLLDSTHQNGPMDHLPRVLGSDALAAPRLVDRIATQNIGLIQAWGIHAAVFAAQANTGLPIVVDLFDPRIDHPTAAKLRSITPSSTLALACTSATIQRRLVEKGVDPHRCALIRPGVDFGRINAARKSTLRQTLALPDSCRLFLTPDATRRDGSQMAAFWTVGLRGFLKTPQPDVLALPGVSTERARIARLAKQLKLDHHLRCPDADSPTEDLIAVADGLLLPSATEVPTTVIAWAMAAGVPVIAGAVHATAELIAHKHNGLLVKPAPAKTMAIKVAALLNDRDTLAQMAETARGQAFEVFSVRRYVDQHTRLYDNLLANRAPAEGITDSAVVTG